MQVCTGIIECPVFFVLTIVAFLVVKAVGSLT